jgi:hypothetical protein
VATLYLYLSPEFPADLAGELIELTTKSGKDDTYWLMGTLPYCDIQLKPTDDKKELLHYRAISRIQCTIKHEYKTGLYMILDGGIYIDEKDSSAKAVRPSSNGVWLNGERLLPKDWTTINYNDRIHFGNDKKIIVKQSPYDTCNEDIWNDEQWRCGPYKEEPCSPIEDGSPLMKHAKENASPWTILSDVFTWLKAPSASWLEQITKLFFIGLGGSILISDEIESLLKWLFQQK